MQDGEKRGYLNVSTARLHELQDMYLEFTQRGSAWPWVICFGGFFLGPAIATYAWDIHNEWLFLGALSVTAGGAWFGVRHDRKIEAFRTALSEISLELETREDRYG